MNRRLLVLSFHAPPDNAVGGLRWSGLSRYLTERGWQVRLITASTGADEAVVPEDLDIHVVRQRTILQDHYRRWRKRSAPSRATIGASAAANGGDDAVSGSGFLRSSLADALSFPDHGRGWITRAARATRDAIREWAPDTVASTGPPHSVHLAAGLGLIGTGVPWIVDLRDPWMTPSHDYQEAAWNKAVTRRLEKLVFGRASMLLTTTPELRDELASHFPRTGVHWLPNGVDPAILPARPAVLPSGLSITHLGSVYYNRDPAPVLKAFARFLAGHAGASDGAILRFVGHISDDFRPGLERSIEELGLAAHVEIRGSLPRERALELLARSHVALVLAQGQDVMVPAKLYEAVGIGLPTLVVTEPDSATGREGRRVGAAVHAPEDQAGMAGTLERVWSGAWGEDGVAPPPVDHAHLAGKLEAILLAAVGRERDT